MATLSKTPPTLAELEQVIASGLRTFVDVGHALTVIRDGDLYKATHKTFELYCADRWQFSKSRASQLITAAEAVVNVYHGKLPAPDNERQARELAKLAPKDQPKAWAEAVKTAPDGVVTAKHVAAVVAERLPKPEPRRVTPSPAVEQNTADVANDCTEALHAEIVPPSVAEKWECESCGTRWPREVSVCAECDAPSGTAQRAPEASEEEDDDTPDAAVESSKLYRLAVELMAPFSGRDLRAFDAVLSQLLGRVQKEMKRVSNA